MKALNIPWLDLELAFERMPDDLFDVSSKYFDKETGLVVDKDETVRDTVDSILEETGEMVAEDMDWTEEDVRRTATYEALSETDKRIVLAAIQIEFGDCPERFVKIPQLRSREAFEWMEDFAETIQDDNMRERLTAALNYRKPFYHFREAIRSDRRLQRQWNSFESARKRAAITAWLKSVGVQPLNVDEPTYEPPPLPELRKIMFAEVLWFVRRAREIAGVQRIALVGSLASDKEFPKDIDMLITIDDECDLTELARLGRQIAGHMNAHQAGADVFLANTTNKYLGRTCPWKNCGLGIRASCDAQSCGARHYLHDDFSSIRLDSKLIQHPPVQLWPVVSAEPSVPPDVNEHLIRPLLMDQPNSFS